ncbi:MAG: hypothetical protein BGN96_13515 [Bacteroidales bacterium 45-6]|nr:MAG: hypothetical protein BGN96_13515 [Bacteroidales bacterium 45-6]
MNKSATTVFVCRFRPVDLSQHELSRKDNLFFKRERKKKGAASQGLFCKRKTIVEPESKVLVTVAARN